MKWCVQHPLFVILCALFGVGLAIESWQSALLVAGVVILVFGFAEWVRIVDRDHNAKVIEIHRLEADADFEHHLTLEGDERGTYGRYPPK
jgi:uncharacterized membrane protein